MTNWSFDPDSNSGTLMVDGDMTINNVGDLKSRLVDAFASAHQVTVDVSAATGIDVAGLQLLCACERFSSGRGQRMVLRIGDNVEFEQFLDEVGFSRDFICSHADASESM